MMGCPAADCSGGHAPNQHQITDAQREIIADDALLGDGESWSSVYRCGYCGAIYVRGDRPRILGDLDNAIIGKGWRPRRSR
jgi:hypothetical protein